MVRNKPMNKTQIKTLIRETIKEMISEDEGTKGITYHLLGLRQERIVIEGPWSSIKQHKDAILKLTKKHDPQSKVEFYIKTGRLVGPYARAKLQFLQRDLKQLDPNLKAELRSKSLVAVS